MTVGELIVARTDDSIAGHIGLDTPERVIAIVRATLAWVIPQLWAADVISDDPTRTDIHHLILLKPQEDS